MSCQGEGNGVELDTTESTIFDQKFQMQLKDRPRGSKDEMKQQKSKDINQLKKEMARRDEKLIQQYMVNMHDKPAALPKDELTQQVLTVASDVFDAKQLQKLSDVLNPKTTQMMVDTVFKNEANRRFERKWGANIAGLLRGRLGVDLFVITFAVGGLIGIPAYFLYKQHKVKQFMRERGIAPISVDDLNSSKMKDVDLDDISIHVNYYDQSQLRQKLLTKVKVEKEVQELQEELYGSRERAKERSLFGPSKSDSSKD